MFLRSSFGGCSLRSGTRFVSSLTLCMMTTLLAWYLISLYRREQLLASLNVSLGFDVKPGSSLTEFVAFFGLGLILLFEALSSWMAIKATTLENRWLLLPFIGMTTCGIISLVLIAVAVLTSQHSCNVVPHSIAGCVSLLVFVLLRTYFLLVACSYYQELQDRDARLQGSVPSVTSHVPQIHIDDLPAHKRISPILLDYLRPPPYEIYEQEQNTINSENKGDLGMRLYM